jgi:ATP-binding cassette subfamily F protein 3
MILREVATKLVIFHQGGVEFFPGTYDDFLEKIGWEEEETKRKKPKKNKGEAGGDAAALKAQRLKALVPVKREMDALESKIGQLEVTLKKHTDDLLEASQAGNADRIHHSSALVKHVQREIDQMFEALSILDAKYQKELG